MVLFFHIHRRAGLEFHGKFVLVDGNLFKSAVEQGIHRRRPAWWAVPQKSVHVSNALFLIVRRLPIGASAFPPAGGRSRRPRPHSRHGWWSASKVLLQFSQLFAPVVPVNPAVELITGATVHDVRQAILKNRLWCEQ